jgi:hypothetical protein
VSQPPAWFPLLREASSPQAVLAIANEFLNRLDRFEVDALCKGCKPRPLLTGAELNGYAIDLMRCEARDAQAAKAVRHVSAFFQEAAQRLSQLSSPARPMAAELWQPKSTKA